jgi:hypothetical protein
MAIKALRALQQYILREVLKDAPKGVMQTLPNKDLLELNVQVLAQRLMQAGIDPTTLKNANQVENAIKMIEDRPAVQEGITSTESAKVFNIKGDELDPNKPIIGGTQPGKKIDTDTFIRLAERNPQLIKQKIANKKVETNAEIKARLDKGNKEGIARIKNKKMVKDAIDNASPGFVRGDRKYNAQLVAEDLADKKFGKEFYDLDQRQQMDLYDEALEGLAEQTRGMPDPEDFAQGGIARLGFKDGMTRRTFLKILGGAMAIPIVGKFLKPFRTAKGVTKVPMIKTDDVAGKPEWFDQLVNKVIVEGDDVTKKFATGERQSIHQKTLDDGSVVRVTEDVDQGAVRVEYQSEKNVFGDDVQLEYKKPLPDEGDPRPTAEFTTAESGPVGRGGRSPDGDDFEIDVDEVGGTSIRDLNSDVSKLKEYATGQKPTMKEIVQNKKRRDKAEAITEDPEAQMDAVIRRQGEMLDVDPEPDFASGGIARMLGE